MLYAILCYDNEEIVGSWSKEKDDAVMASHGAAMQKLAAKGKLGPVARLMNTTTATTLRSFDALRNARITSFTIDVVYELCWSGLSSVIHAE